MMSVESSLNQFGELYLSGNLLEKFSPVEFVGDCSFTLIEEGVEAFNLTPLKAGTLKSVTSPQEPKTNAGLTRQLIGYPLAYRISQNENSFQYEMSMIINEALSTLTRNLGNLDGREAFAGSPGNPLKYFRHLENVAGFEIRIYVPKK